MSIVIPGTTKDWYYILEGLLEQETLLRPVEITSDTAGASEMGFGTFRLLGWQFSPRLADAGSATLYLSRIDPAASYGPINNLTRPRINTTMIRDTGTTSYGSPGRCSPARSDPPSCFATSPVAAVPPRSGGRSWSWPAV